MDINYKFIKEFVKKKWIYILIIFGIFLVLWRPTVNIKSDRNENKQHEKIDWFKDISISDTSKKDSITTYKDIKVEPIQNINEEEIRLNENKKLILNECLRQEPDLSKWHVFNTDRKNIPTLDYIVSVLESKYDKRVLYGDIEKGVDIILRKAGVKK